MSQPSSGCFCCGGTSGSLNLAGLAEQLALNASPYNVHPSALWPGLTASMLTPYEGCSVDPWHQAMECARAAVGRGARPLHWHQLLRDIRAAVGLLQRREAGPRHAAEVRHAHHLCKHPCGRGRFPGPERPANTAQHSAALGVACAGCEAGRRALPLLRRTRHADQGLHDAAEEFDQCLLPVDYEKNGCILDNDVHKVLLSRLPAGVRLTAVFDCCTRAR
ncbi:hypothetical protein ERJ75_000314500 [Trypanosoma vivax]|nr:hypothetical protein ERJ75_000314500 [Trypanosoma vivax]